MRTTLGIVIIAALLWCGWWFFAANQQEAALTRWLDGRQADGWVAERQDLSVSGFPNRLDATIEDLLIADPRSGWAWSAPILQILMLSYQPNHAIMVLPGEQRISTPRETVTVTSDTLRASVRFVPETDLRLDKTQAEIRDLSLTGPDWQVALAAADFATRLLGEDEAPGHAHQIGLTATDLHVPGLSSFLKRRVPGLSERMDRAHFDAVLSFDAPWDRHAVEGEKPRLTAFRLKDLDLAWGKLRLEGRGALGVDAAGHATGELNIKARNWVDMLEVAVAAGAMDRRLSDQVKNGLSLLAMLSGDKDEIDIPLTFKRGETRIGPVPIGPAPRLAPPR